MALCRFNEKQKAEYNRRVTRYYNEGFFLKDARVQARTEVEGIILMERLDKKREVGQ